jgi:hypothetical protein
MKIVNTLTVLVVLMAVACVGMHLYIVEGEFNVVRQTTIQQAELNGALEAADRAIVFATETQYIAVMAEERACELGAKLDAASLIVGILEEHLEQATSVVESQCEQIRELIDLNSDLQSNSTWQDEEMARILAEQQVLEEELIDALHVAEDRRLALVEAQGRIDVTAATLATLEGELSQALAELAKTLAELEALQPPGSFE